MLSGKDRLGATLRQMLPALVTLLLMLMVASIGKSFGSLYPLISLMAVYYWGMFRPAALPYGFVFVLGLAQDVLMDLPLGVATVLLLIFRAVVASQQRILAQQVFWMTWASFDLVALLFFLSLWIIMNILSTASPAMQPSIIQWLLSVAMYPFMHLLYNRIYGMLPKL